MHQHHQTLTITTRGTGLYEFTRELAAWLTATGISSGLLTLLSRHTSASLLINENAAPAVQQDLLDWLARSVPEGPYYAHDDEGPDDMPAHIRTMLTGVSLSIPVVDGSMMLGTWQGVYLAEHRAAPHRREVAVHVIGD